ncbi:MAG: apolipoprotein N-acyltransferase [Streptomycetaceae bacterium]|nr:apolipoprotein N-acyltransferase [Streptomycetaceae bacterium]
MAATVPPRPDTGTEATPSSARGGVSPCLQQEEPPEAAGSCWRDGTTTEASTPAPPLEPPAPPLGLRQGRLRRLVRAARRDSLRSMLAAASGLALAASFPPYDLWPLSLAAVAVLALLTWHRTVRQAAWTGFAFAFPFFVWLLQWLHVVGWDAVVGLSVIEAVFFVPLGAGLAVTSRLPGRPLWGACLWVAEELIRDRVPFGGFPWGRLAFANTGSPFTALAALGGAPLVTFALALTAGLLATAALCAVRLRGAVRARDAVGTAVSLVLAAAVVAVGSAVPTATKADGSVQVAIVQGNVDRPGMHFLGRPMEILGNHVQATVQLAREVKSGRVPRPDVVIWPENSSDLDPFSYPQAYTAISQAVQAIGVPVLIGALVDGPDADHVQNEGIVWSPTAGPGAEYTKQHPVPFGEYVPFRKELTKVISRLNEIPLDFYPGKHNGVLQLGPARIGDVICFEVAYDQIVRDTVNAGARAIVVQTNNATYGRTGQPEQQLAMYRLRAVEHGRAVVSAATSGISAVVAPDGTVKQQSEEFTREVLSARIPLRDSTTVADRLGALPEWTLAMVGVLSCAAAIGLGPRRRTEDKG